MRLGQLARTQKLLVAPPITEPTPLPHRRRRPPRATGRQRSGGKVYLIELPLLVFLWNTDYTYTVIYCHIHVAVET